MYPHPTSSGLAFRLSSRNIAAPHGARNRRRSGFKFGTSGQGVRDLRVQRPRSEASRTEPRDVRSGRRGVRIERPALVMGGTQDLKSSDPLETYNGTKHP